MILLFRFVSLLFVALLAIWIIVTRPGYSYYAGEPHDIEPSKLKEEVRRISQDFFPGSSDRTENLNALSHYIFEKFRGNSADVRHQVFEVDGNSYSNVIAKFGPNTNNIFVIGAHYDSYSDLPGADDNASGVTGLIELSRLLKDAKLTKQVQLVAFTLEEPPHFATKNMGSYVHAKSLKEQGVEVDLMISLEMIGFFSEEKGTQIYPIPMLRLFYPSAGDFIAVVDQLNSNQAFSVKSVINRYSNVQAYSINAPEFVTGIDFSDHRNYWRFGYPAVMVTDTAFYRNHTYHTEQDTYEKLDYEKMAEVIFGVHKYITSTQ